MAEDVCKELAAQARGASVVLGACAEVFLNEPTEAVLADIRAVASAVGEGAFESLVADAALRQRYYDRMFVTSSAHYVPLRESCVARGGRDESGAFRYAGVQSARADHALRCYKAVGFDFTQMAGCDFARKSLSADALASELGFLAYLEAGAAAAAERGDEAQAAHWGQLAARFAREHLGAWVGTAAECLASTDDDLYAKTCALAAGVVHELAQGARG